MEPTAPTVPLRLFRAKVRQNLLRRSMLHLFVNDLFVAVQGEVAARRFNVRLGHTKTLSRTRTLPFRRCVSASSGQQVVAGGGSENGHSVNQPHPANVAYRPPVAGGSSVRS